MKKLPILCFVGPMVGKHFGNVTTQGEILSDQFRKEGYSVISVSSFHNRYLRLADIVITLIMRCREIDLQCLQVYGGPSFVIEDIASLIGRLFGQRLVMVMRGGAMPKFMARYPHWCCRVLRRADLIVSPSPFLAKALVAYGFKAQVIPNVIDLSVYKYRRRRQLAPRLYWMRTFHPIYNPQMAILVLAQVRKTIPDATLVIAGQDKGTLYEVEQLVYKMGLQGVVRFPGYLDLAAKVREGNAADIFLNTNHVDNTPVSVIEACAMGLPVIATNVGGISDLLTDRETGLLVPDNDIQKMYEAVLLLLSNPDLAEILSTNGRKLAEQSSWQSVRTSWEKVFENLTSQTSGKIKGNR